MTLLDNGEIYVIAGPTGSGKSQTALDLAQAINGEIISADSMQLYKGLDIGTAKVTREEQTLVKHYLIDVYDITVKSDVFKFVEMAREAIKVIRSRGKIPIIAGGTGFYIKSLLYGLDNLPGDDKLRTEIETEFAGEEGFAELKKLMAEIDPEILEKYQNYHRKLIRAMEVYRLTGKRFSELQSEENNKLLYPNVKSFWIEHDREVLKKRIRKRAEIMLEAGWIEEADELIKQGLLQTPSAWQALGYSLIDRYLKNEFGYEELIEKISTATWQFARRQLTWFRHQHPESIRIEKADCREILERR